MTTSRDATIEVRKGVVVFDIRYSSAILEDLKRTDNLKHWRNFLIRFKERLQGSKIFEIYKFVGDGWILLFDPSTPAGEVLSGLRALSGYYSLDYAFKIKGYLEKEPPDKGLTFGIDCGSLIRITMNGKREYIGRPLNVASRLQSLMKDIDRNPSGKVMMTSHYFRDNRSDFPEGSYKLHKSSLRNISDGAAINLYLVDLKAIG